MHRRCCDCAPFPQHYIFLKQAVSIVTDPQGVQENCKISILGVPKKNVSAPRRSGFQAAKGHTHSARLVDRDGDFSHARCGARQFVAPEETQSGWCLLLLIEESRCSWRLVSTFFCWKCMRQYVVVMGPVFFPSLISAKRIISTNLTCFDTLDWSRHKQMKRDSSPQGIARPKQRNIRGLPLMYSLKTPLRSGCKACTAVRYCFGVPRVPGGDSSPVSPFDHESTLVCPAISHL